MVEAFTAEHNLTYEEVLYEWPASRFEAFYGAFARRKVAEELTLRRSLEMAALWGNPNLDQENDPQLRHKFMREVDEHMSRAIARLYGAEDDTEPDMDDPFFAAMERGMKRQRLPDAQDVTEE